MKAVVLAGIEDVRVEDVPDPAIGEATDALVQVRHTAICGADLLPFRGLTPGFEYGTVLGHEFVGTVVEVGSAVRRIKPQQRVVCTSTVSDGTCAHCRAGRPSQCLDRALFGYSGVYPRLDGGQAELVRVPMADRCLWPLPDSISDEAAIFVADILPTGFGAVQRGQIGVGDLVAVVGCGPVGLMALLCARGAARCVIAIEPIPARRELARRLGAEAVSPEDAERAVQAASAGLGADLVIEAAGSPRALDLALRLVRGRGTLSVVGAHFEPDYPLNNALMFEREITLRFTIGDPASDREKLLAILAERKLDPTAIITHRLPLSEARQAYQLFYHHEATKVVLQP
jgi:2-desacetyl-2-hydroxyethyl bacteriochlorophyllide A dehydrogenase